MEVVVVGDRVGAYSLPGEESRFTVGWGWIDARASLLSMVSGNHGFLDSLEPSNHSCYAIVIFEHSN